MSNTSAKSISSNETIDWESMREVFSTLYVTQGRPLREVRAILAEKYGFFATERMYKRRIHHWQLDKNNKEDEMLFLAQWSARRAACGKKSVFRVRNREITQAALDHYFKRKKVSSRRRSFTEASTPPHIVCYTPPETPSPENDTPIFTPDSTPNSSGLELVLVEPPPVPVPVQPSNITQLSEDKYWLPGSPSQLEAPGYLKTMEVLLTATRDFYSSTIIKTTGVDSYHVVNQSMTWNMRRFYVLANSVASHMSEGAWKEAQSAYGETIDHVGPVLQDRNPILFVCLLQICCKFSKDGQLPALRPLLQLIRGMAAHVHSVSHSVHILCGALLQSLDILPDIMTMGLRQAVDILKIRLGAEHPQTCAAGRGLHTSLMAKKDFAGALQAFQPVADIEAGLKSAMTIESMYRIIGCRISLMHIKEARILIEKAESMVAALEEGEQKIQFTLCRLSTRGEWLRLQRDPRAISILSQAVEFAKNNKWLHNGSWTLNARKALRLARHSEDPLLPFIFWF